MADLQGLRYVARADVFKGGHLAGTITRTDGGGTSFSYDPAYLTEGRPAVATTIPVTADADADAAAAAGGALPPFFTGLLPEGHRLTVLRNAAKTSLDDELTLLLAVGADVPGDVQVVPAGEKPAEPAALADTTKPEELDFAELAGALDLHGLPGVQDKASASMLTAPLAMRRHRYILKLDPPEYPHLVPNEALHLTAARKLKIPVAKASVVTDKRGTGGLLVERFDRQSPDGKTWTSLPQEDAAQVMGLPPASKYNVSAEDAVNALTEACRARPVAARNLYLQFLFAWLTGNGDLHAKNISILGGPTGFAVAPVYDVPCTLLYGDDTLALSIAGRTKGLKARHWTEFAEAISLPARAAASANRIALAAAATVDLTALPVEGSPLRGAVRELRHRRAELDS
ncbi:HipA domain-containing protein [Arthrobacter sp. zg-Y1110]|uniref:type II toxin-antitoxin system HipA family toxin n=1 Tax=Arthrobacter sp. zg-Y1110 TaxID=2886932 RepID=UPI0027E20E30|nr:HipA domain-containing protein [Arthrobacter sp. zg-Y1110]